MKNTNNNAEDPTTKRMIFLSLESLNVSDLSANRLHHQEGLIDIQGAIKEGRRAGELAIFRLVMNGDC